MKPLRNRRIADGSRWRTALCTRATRLRGLCTCGSNARTVGLPLSFRPASSAGRVIGFEWQSSHAPQCIALDGPSCATKNDCRWPCGPSANKTASLGHRGGRDVSNLPRAVRRLFRYRTAALCHHFPSSASCFASIVFSSDSATRTARARPCASVPLRARPCVSVRCTSVRPNGAPTLRDRCVGQRFELSGLSPPRSFCALRRRHERGPGGAVSGRWRQSRRRRRAANWDSRRSAKCQPRRRQSWTCGRLGSAVPWERTVQALHEGRLLSCN